MSSVSRRKKTSSAGPCSPAATRHSPGSSVTECCAKHDMDGSRTGLHQGEREFLEFSRSPATISPRRAGDALQGPRPRGPVVPARAALARVQGRMAPQVVLESTQRTSSSTSRSNLSRPRARSALNPCGRTAPPKQFATISSSSGNSLETSLRARMIALFPQIHSKERDVFENHGKKLTAG